MTASATTVDGRLAERLDKDEISELIDRYLVTLDTAELSDRDLAWYRRIFTDDVRLVFPIGERVGTEGLAEFQRTARLAWQATHHVSANHVVDVAGDRATARVQLIGTHLDYDTTASGVEHAHRMDMGGYYDVTAVRTDRGWRVDYLRFVVVWLSGGGKPNANYSTAL
ncbi:nuclear transport factor 2 family protein [Actinokineospora sp. PR83]|uniref:nuclear transport factor 2 family protein n=1 Tax=Actinokineospora sp. PR83 TaxID=2884908 RepID=UPI001F34233D|nr:nuclear transport factor 2 family protein [Actinokineospora sp. PR83]MCG8916948.1 nuclear transport factor 2 family protein [Actinokineospora sp. PR83]